MTAEILKGVWIGNSPVWMGDTESIFRKGHEWELSTIFQVSTVSAVLAQLDLYYPLSWYERIPAYLVPYAVSARLLYTNYFGDEEGKTNPKLIDKLAYHLHMKFNLCVRAFIVFTAIATYKQQRIRSTAILATAGIASLISWDQLRATLDPHGSSAAALKAVQKALFVLEAAGALAHGGIPNYFNYGCYTLYGGYRLFFSTPAPVAEAPTIDSLKEMPANKRNLRVNRSDLSRGVHGSKAQPPAGANINDLLDAMKFVLDDPESASLIKKSIESINRYQEEPRYANNPMKFFEDGINAFVQNTKAKVLKDSDLISTYGLILASEAKKLMEAKQYESLRKNLVDIAVAAHQCETAWLSECRELVRRQTGIGSLEEKLLTAMGTQRELLLRQICNDLRKDVRDIINLSNNEGMNWLSKVRAIDTNREHTWNWVVVGWGRELGLPSYENSLRDQSIPLSDLLAYSLKTHVRTLGVLNRFDEVYTSEWIINQMQKILNDPNQHGIKPDALRIEVEKWMGIENSNDPFPETVEDEYCLYTQEFAKNVCLALELLTDQR